VLFPEPAGPARTRRTGSLALSFAGGAISEA
jgi:hypothetical protein